MAQKPNYFDLTGDVSATSTSSISVPNDVAIQASRRKAESEKKREQEKQKKKDEDYKNFLERKEAGELNAIELLSSDEEEEEENLVVPSAATKRAKSKSSAPGSRVADASYQRSPKHTLKEKTTTHFSNLAASSNPTSDGRKILSSAARHPGRSSSTLQEGVQQSLSQETPFRTKAATSSAISTPVKASSASSDFREDRSSSNFVDSDKRSQKRTERQALHSTVSPQMVESGSSSRLLPSYQNELSPHREKVRSPRSNVTAKLNFGEALQTRSTSEKIANLSTEGDNVKHLSVETLPPVTLEDPVETGSSMGSKMLSTSKESSGASKLQDHESPFPTVGHRGKPHLKRDAESHALLTPALTPAPLSEHAESLDQLQEEAMPIPLHVENVERLLSRHRETLKEHQEALLTSNFARAEQQHRTFAGPAIYRSKPSPFQKLIAQKMTTDISTKGGRQESLIIQTACARSKPEKKTLTAHLDVSQFASNGQYVPKVKSIGRLGASRDILARNVHTLTYMPWFPENETDTATAEEKKRYEEVEGRYNNNIKTRALMRRCRAIANMWQPEVERMMEQLGISCGDIVYYMLHTDENEQPTEGTLSPPMLELWNDRAEDCPSCEVSEYCRSSEYTRIAPLLRRPSTERRLAMAGLFCEVFYRIVKVNLWHVISQMESTIQIYQDCMDRIDKRPEAQRNDLSTFCYACGQFSCTIHGAFHSEEEDMNADNSMEATSSSPPARCTGSESFSDDDSKSEASPEGEVVLDDVELNLNIREHATIPLRPARQRSTEQHLCGAFCVDLGTRVKDIVGLHLNGKVSGAMRADLCSEDSPPFDDLTPCDSDVCFWTVRNRSDTVLDLSRSKFNGFLDTADGRLYQSLLPIAFTSKRGPCELAFAISSSTCLEIFCFMLCSIRSSPHLGGMKPSTPSKKTETIVDLSSDKHLEDRINFVPCSHSGTCQLDVCACVAGTISCESSCGCSAACSRRFKGCSCRDGRRKVCFEDTRCECWANNRECDPALCGACGVQEVLDPANRDSSEFNHCCRNNRIQLGIPRRTVMGVSEVHGWGLFAGEYIPRSEFISEYKGELISISEGDRRGAVYHNLGLEYLFKLSHDQELDGSRFSNKSRFINNSSVSRNINVFSKKMLCNGVSRIMLYSARDILAGEELFYNYGYDKDVREHFKEKPDLTKKPTLPRTLSTTASFTTPSIASGTALSEPVGSVMSFTNTALDFDELEEESAPPISEPDSEFEGSASDELTGDASDDDEDDEVEAEAEDGARINLQNILAPSTGLRRPKSKDGPSGRPVARPNLYALPDSLEERPRKKAKRWNLSQIRQPQAQAQGSDSDIPLRRRTLSRTQSNDKPADEPEVHPKRVPINQRKRSISVNDKRLGGDAQRKAAQTLKARRAMQAAREAEKSSGAVGGKKRKRSDTLSSPSKEPSSPQPLMFRLTQPNMVAIGGAGLSKTATPESRPRALTRSPQFSSDAASASMSVSSRSASPAKQVSPQMVAQNGSLASSWSK